MDGVTYTRPVRPAALSAAVYVALALLAREGLPFVRFPAFRFPVANGAVAVPLFRVDGVDASPEDYVGFHGLSGADVDVHHAAYACAVEHRLHELAAWIDAQPGAAPGTASVELGLRILEEADGRIVERARVDATGTARPR